MEWSGVLQPATWRRYSILYLTVVTCISRFHQAEPYSLTHPGDPLFTGHNHLDSSGSLRFAAARRELERLEKEFDEFLYTKCRERCVGPAGPRGDPGPQGAQGPQGPQGPKTFEKQPHKPKSSHKPNSKQPKHPPKIKFTVPKGAPRGPY